MAREVAGLTRHLTPNNLDQDRRGPADCRRGLARTDPLAAVRSTFQGAGCVELLSTRLGVRPMPVDGEPIVGAVAEVPGRIASHGWASRQVLPSEQAVKESWVDVSETGGGSPVVTLSDGMVTLRPWSRDDARFMAEASADPAIRRYNGVHDRQGWPSPPLSISDAEAAIDQFALNWRAFATTGTPSGVAFAIMDARSGELGRLLWRRRLDQRGRSAVRLLDRSKCERTRLRDSSGDPPHTLVVRAWRGSRLLDDRRGE